MYKIITSTASADSAMKLREALTAVLGLKEKGHMSYSSGSVGLIALSSALIVIALMIVILCQGDEPLPPAMIPPAASTRRPDQSVPAETGIESVLEKTAPVFEMDKNEVVAREFLVLRLLSGDERTMFKAIMDSGDGALQKDLIVRTKMSNAKVSRLLNRLEQKGVITKERYGATNKIRIKPD